MIDRLKRLLMVEAPKPVEKKKLSRLQVRLIMEERRARRRALKK